MGKKNTISTIFMMFFILFLFNSAMAGIAEENKVELSTDVFSEIMDIPERGIPESLLENAHGIAIIPGVIKAAFVVGGRYGQGILSVRSKNGTWSNPAFIKFTGGSIGFQIGAQSTDIILVFSTKRSIDGIIKGKYTLGADAAIAAGPVGRQAEASTDIQLKAEIYSYSRSRGLFAGISLEGAALQIDDNANVDFYNQEYISPSDILYKNNVKTLPSAKKLINLLNKY